MALPIISLTLTNTIYGFPDEGNLVYQYSPFQNLLNPAPTTPADALSSLRIDSIKAGLNITEPIDLNIEVAYDDSANLIVSDQSNPPKIVNSRFYPTSSTTYNIADRKGNLDTNIYSADNFKIEAGLVKSVRTLTKVVFNGISSGGKMPVGNYTFYFKLADADGNETDFIAESGKVVCHIGIINNPSSIRGGQMDENSNKLIKFTLKDLDLAYDYINIYYTRSSGDGLSELTRAYKISDKYRVTNNDTSISITGYEVHEQISIDDINIQYTNFDSVKTLANCQNITFAGGPTNDYKLYKTLEKYSLFITPQLVYDTQGIGNLQHDFKERYTSQNYGYEYYNAKNIYYKLSYWDEEIYRVGIIYIMNDYTLSPVFSIRGIRELDLETSFSSLDIRNDINYGEDYLLGSSIGTNYENAKGVFKINNLDASKKMFDNEASIKPLGLKFNFDESVIDGISEEFIPGLKDLTKGFFIVRQKRIPTILAQSIGIATSKKAYFPLIKALNPVNPLISTSYFAESFLKPFNSKPKLGSTLFSIDSNNVVTNALLCPEASVRRAIFNSFFNSSEFVLKSAKFGTNTKWFTNYNPENKAPNFSIKWLNRVTTSPQFSTKLTLVEPGIELIGDSNYKFSSKAGDALIAHKHLDPILGDYTDPENPGNYDFSTTTSKVRGEFNTFIGCSTDNIVHGEYYNIFEKDYDFDLNWKEYFLVRYNDASPYYPISDRMNWSDLIFNTTKYESLNFFRGDCYINTVSQRMNWNFVDPSMPTNQTIVDPYTWYKNFRVVKKASTIISNNTEPVVVDHTTLSYWKLLPLFTYRSSFIISFSGETDTEGVADGSIIEPDGRKFNKYSTLNGLFGAEKINLPDVNAVPLGYWVTFKICSNYNLAMRDIDFSRTEEEATHKQKRSFHPLQALNKFNSLPESDIINNGISKTVGDKYYFEVPDVPFIKTNFANRINYSNVLQNASFTNGNRIFEAKNYQDYTREYGSITKLIEWYGKLIVVMEHGIILIPVNERAMMTNSEGENVYINTVNTLPQNPKIISNTFGSIWTDSVIKTSMYIYGIDTVAKKIWRTNGEKFENISDFKIQKFLNDKISLKETDKDRTIQVNFIKSHYNAFKQDILFVFKYGDLAWNLCWNELLEKWTTQYTWFPEFSENINNIFYTFANQEKHTAAINQLYKHGFAGVEEELGTIEPTLWYDVQHPFEFEFIVSEIPGIQKIFDNLKIISNNTEPDSLFYEIVGEGFDWYNYKNLILQLNDTSLATIDGITLTTVDPAIKDEDDVKTRYREYLTTMNTLPKLPYIYIQSFDVNDPNSFYRDRGTITPTSNMASFRDLSIRENNKTKEKLVNSYQKGTNIKTFKRIKGNMQYLEDCWDVQIQPIVFKYAYVSNGILNFSGNSEMRIRDKYIKIRVKYKGDKYAIINALRTLFTISYA